METNFPQKRLARLLRHQYAQLEVQKNAAATPEERALLVRRQDALLKRLNDVLRQFRRECFLQHAVALAHRLETDACAHFWCDRRAASRMPSPVPFLELPPLPARPRRRTPMDSLGWGPK